jgi:thiosulfate/3-mercaptopyruvate sulfurtransferase
MAAPLVSAHWLAERLGDPGLRLIDLRLPADGGRAGFEAAHVPGAIFSDYAADGWRARVGTVPGLLPAPGHLSSLLGRLGITPAMHVVLIPTGSGANDFAASARAFWTLKLCGHAAISILDRGLAGWIAEGLPVQSGVTDVVSAMPYPVQCRDDLRSEAGATQTAMEQRTHVLLDGRSAGYFAGLEKAGEALRAGHIPGAISLDYAGLFDPVRHGLKVRAELEALIAVVPPGPVISYCNTGHTAALNWFVLSEVFGWPDVTLYDGSMTDWTQDDSRPVVGL